MKPGKSFFRLLRSVVVIMATGACGNASLATEQLVQELTQSMREFDQLAIEGHRRLDEIEKMPKEERREALFAAQKEVAPKFRLLADKVLYLRASPGDENLRNQYYLLFGEQATIEEEKTRAIEARDHSLFKEKSRKGIRMLVMRAEFILQAYEKYRPELGAAHRKELLQLRKDLGVKE